MKWLLLSLVVVSTVLSDLLQSYELKRAGTQTISARGVKRLLITIAHRRYLLLSIAFLAVSFFGFMALVQTAPLSFAVPASAASFTLEIVLAKLVLKEPVGLRRATGATLVLCGVILIAR